MLDEITYCQSNIHLITIYVIISSCSLNIFKSEHGLTAGYNLWARADKRLSVFKTVVKAS
jgi:hypothetical protein